MEFHVVQAMAVPKHRRRDLPGQNVGRLPSILCKREQQTERVLERFQFNVCFVVQFLGVGAIYKGANLNILLFIASLLKCCDIIHGINNLSVLSAYEFNTLLSQRKIGFPELA